MRLPVKYLDRPFWAMYGLLVVVSLIALFSAGSALALKYHSIFFAVSRQMFFLFLGLIAICVLQYMPSKWLRYTGYPLLAFALICLYLMLIPHNPFVVVKGEAARWFNAGFVQFQPSEIAKFSLVLVIADLLSRIQSEEDKKKYFFLTLGVTALTVVPILFGNLSTALLLVGVVFLLWVLAHIPWRFTLGFVGIMFTVMICSYFYVEKAYIQPKKAISEHHPFKRVITWAGRVDAFLDSQTMTEEEYRKDMNGRNYQRSLANAAVVLGGKSPIGVLPGNSKQRDYLPVAYADFIFSIIVEETGFVGAFFLIFLYLAILFRACFVSLRYSDYASVLMMMGLALMITCQALISMAVAVGLGPTTGQPLPLVSAGGTSAVITSLYFGYMFAVAREQNALQTRMDDTDRENQEQIPNITLDL